MFPLFDYYKQQKAARRIVYNTYDGNSFQDTCITDRIAIIRYTLTAKEDESCLP